MANEIIIAILEKYGIKVGEYLDSGMMGTVYKYKDEPSKVIKITMDKSEANAMELVRKQPHPNIVKVYEVYKIDAGVQVAYAIIQEKLDILGSSERNSWNWIDNDFLSPKDTTEFSNYDDIDMFSNEYFGCDFDAVWNWAYENEEVEQEYKKMITDIFPALQHLGDIGIRFGDYHSGNIMIGKGGNYKLIDIGVSESPAQKIDILESIISKIVENVFSSPFLK